MTAAAADTTAAPKAELSADEKRDRYEKRLWYWNLSMGIMHLIWAIICVVVGCGTGRAGKFKTPEITTFPDWSGGASGPVAKMQFQGLVPFTALTSGFAFMSATAHLLICACFKIYIADLRTGINRFRWFEYAASSSLMSVLIAMLFGVWDVHILFLLGSINACMNFFGYSFEVQNKIGEKIDWSNFIFGCWAGACPWAVILSYVCNNRSANVPAFVWAILAVYIIMFQTFPVNMVLQYAQIGRWYKDEAYGFPMGGYYFGEKVYQVLSLTAKTALLWLVVAGTNQPSSVTGN